MSDLFNTIPKRVQVLIYNGYEACCACCGKSETLTFDHIIPLGKGGKDCNTNGQILCLRCNGVKADNIITLDELRIKLIKNKQ